LFELNPYCSPQYLLPLLSLLPDVPTYVLAEYGLQEHVTDPATEKKEIQYLAAVLQEPHRFYSAPAPVPDIPLLYNMQKFKKGKTSDYYSTLFFLLF
jgi:hypothetical protein